MSDPTTISVEIGCPFCPIRADVTMIGAAHHKAGLGWVADLKCIVCESTATVRIGATQSKKSLAP